MNKSSDFNAYPHNSSTSSQSRPVHSIQSGPHHRLTTAVYKHLDRPFRKSIADYNYKAFDLLRCYIEATQDCFIVDAGCGTGDSTRRLAALNAGVQVIGIDKSAHRLAKERKTPDPANMALIRADMVDIWRLLRRQGLRPERQFILYPNPWPKPQHLARRWHGHPVFADIVALGSPIELRTNWKIYAEEFQLALEIAGVRATLSNITAAAKAGPLTPFEAKYTASGQQVWACRTD